MRRALLTLTLTGVLALAACGGDDDDASSATTAATPTTAAVATTTPEPTAAPQTTAAPATTEPPATTAALDTTAVPAGGYVAGADPDADAAATTWKTVFDSTLGFAEKATLVADPEALQATIEAYTPAGQAVGGIALVPTAVVVAGDSAAITYDVTFAGQPAYQGQTGSVQRVGDTWQVSREEFCGFMAAARNPCPAG